MHFDTNFKGRVIQVTEAISLDDAVSNQVLALDQMLLGMGLQSAAASADLASWEARL